ncbi:hypothetical protein BC826DRAFT_1000540 [Russula brevipes]|nr:hypothetical protein BC826DRAFT_1000540 [Russula brevipes]
MSGATLPARRARQEGETCRRAGKRCAAEKRGVARGHQHGMRGVSLERILERAVGAETSA